MYPPDHHQIQDQQKMIAVIRQFPLGMLVSAIKNKPFITHIPIIYNEPSGRLVAHIDKFNPQLESLYEGAEVSVVFKGPDTYISPSVYSTTQLPTWNYIIVHINGIVHLIEDEEAAKKTMIDMTHFLEGAEQKFVLEKENKRMQRSIHYIKAFDIEIKDWEGKFKLSQDKNEEDQKRAKDALLNASHPLHHSFIHQMYK